MEWYKVRSNSVTSSVGLLLTNLPLSRQSFVVLDVMFVIAVAAAVIAVNPIQTGLFWPSLDWGGASNASPPPLRFLKTIKDIDMKLTPLIKRREINLLLLSYLNCDVT